MSNHKKRVIVLIHGIRTNAWWQHRAAARLEDRDTIVIPIKYGYLDVVSFWLPIPYLRTKPLQRVQRELNNIFDGYPDKDIYVLAHSFGTYAIANILFDNPHFRLSGLILCGSIVPKTFNWFRIHNQIVNSPKRDFIVNECGLRDAWPLLAQSLTWGYGASGTQGFGTADIKDRFHPTKHSDYFTEQFIDTFWIPFIRRNELFYTQEDKLGSGTPWWFFLLQFPYKWLAAASAVAALLWAITYLPIDLTFRTEQTSDIRIDRFAVSPDTDDMAWLRGKVERNIVEYLDKHRVSVSSENSATFHSSHRVVLRGRVTASPDGDTVTVEANYIVGKREAGSAIIQGPAKVIRDIYHSIPDAIFHSLRLVADGSLKRDHSVRITESALAFALFVEAKKRAAVHDFVRASNLLQMAVGADPRFAAAHWAMAEILSHGGDESAAAHHRESALGINPDHPRISILPAPTNPLPILRERMRQSPWTMVEPGMDYKNVDASEYELYLHFWRINLANFEIRVAKASDVRGSTATQMREAYDAVGAFSGGFFEMDSANRLSPSGLLIINGQALAKRSTDPKLSGILGVTRDSIRITPAGGELENAGYLFALQSGPRLIEADGRLGIYKNDWNRLERTGICLRDNDVIVGIAKGSGLSLFEFASVLIEQREHGGPGCAVALNLDGGPSSQGSVKVPSHAVEVPGLWKIDHGVLIVRRGH